MDLPERQAIADMLHATMSVNKIAPAIGGRRSTVCREIRRDRFEGDAFPDLNDYRSMTARRTAG
ncbi:MAG: helix-turn-helix domain-containing protein [Pseudomonadota bacterium]